MSCRIPLCPLVGSTLVMIFVSSPSASAADEFVAMTFNVGTTLRLPHDDGPDDEYTSIQAKSADTWYGNGLAWLPAIEAVRKFIQKEDPDVVALQEVFDCRECASVPVEHRRGFVCETWAPGEESVARRVLGPDFQIAYHPEKPSKCLAVHRRLGKLLGCRGGNCDDALEGIPIEGCGSGARVARATVQRPDGSLLTIISVHGTSGLKPADQQCRVRQVERIFVDFGDGTPGVRPDNNLILGDFNTDPWRVRDIDASAKRWNDFAGPGKSFQFISKMGPDAPGAYQGFADIDHIVSDTFVGTCRYPGVGEDSPSVWDSVLFDHVPVVCTIAQ